MVSLPQDRIDSSLAIDGATEHQDEMPFTLHGKPSSELQTWFWDGLKSEMHRQGHAFRSEVVEDIRLVVNFTELEEPQPFRRKAQGTFVVTIVQDSSDPADIIRAGYPVLVRALSNLGIYLVPLDGRVIAHFLTMEQGHYIVEKSADEPDEQFFAEVYERLAPLATSQLVINNEYIPDLPAFLWDGDETTAQITWAGERLGDLALLPAPWPIQEILGDRDLKHVMRLFGIGGLSYGNLSARYDDERFWMSASGVDKTNLRAIGRDILLVSGYVRERNAMVLSVPPHIQPRRVSVDAIEHFMIYREHPSVGAIIHIHAWMDGIESTHINFPCGTRELAVAVSDLIRNAPDPSRAVVGLKNHGMTLTGHSLPEIFERIDGKIIPQVPMS